MIPFAGYSNLLKRRFEEAIDIFLAAQAAHGPSDAISSALAAAYRALAFQTLADQVRRSVRSVRGNQWMFRIGHPADHPLRLRPELLQRGADGLFPILRETHAGAHGPHAQRLERHLLPGHGFSRRRAGAERLDRPGGARPRRRAPQPPVEAYLRVIDEPVLRLVSVDLERHGGHHRPRRGLRFRARLPGPAQGGGDRVRASCRRAWKAPAQPLADLLAQLIGEPGLRLEIVSNVNDIPKGSRLAVSTNLLACLIAVCMRATGQTTSLTGALERRASAGWWRRARSSANGWAARGGGWQDSGGVWPGIKLIQGVTAAEGDPEFGISRGRLLPHHQDLRHATRFRGRRASSLQESLVLVHGGMAQNVGPDPGNGDREVPAALGGRVAGPAGRRSAFSTRCWRHLRAATCAAIGGCTQRNFDGPIQTIIPWASNLYTETLIERCAREFGEDFWGFWMLGGMSGGGMGFLFGPRAQAAGAGAPAGDHERDQAASWSTPCRSPWSRWSTISPSTSAARGRRCCTGDAALMPAGYYALAVPPLLRTEARTAVAGAARRAGALRAPPAATEPEFAGMVQQPVRPPAAARRRTTEADARRAWKRCWTTTASTACSTSRSAPTCAAAASAWRRIACRPAPTSRMCDAGDVLDATSGLPAACAQSGWRRWRAGAVAVVSLAGGRGQPLDARARAWSRRCIRSASSAGGIAPSSKSTWPRAGASAASCGTPLPHVVTTSYLTHDADRAAPARASRTTAIPGRCCSRRAAASGCA